MKIFEKFEENIAKHPNKVIWADDDGEYTGEYIERLSGQVYAYIKDKGLGTEKVIMIKLPHGVNIPICEYGIYKAGACCIVVADWVNDEQLEFFKKDSGCDFIIDAQIWEEIIATPYRYGWEEPDEHDAAYIVYTSSSTGKPKGVVHEYGDFEYIIKDLVCTDMIDGFSERYAWANPFYDLIGFYDAINVIYIYGFALILPVNSDPFDDEIRPLYEKYCINNTGLMLNRESLRKAEQAEFLKYVYTGYEPLMGIYSETLPIINAYGMTESCIPLTYFIIDKYYDIVPVGKPTDIRPLYILDEDDNILSAGEIGEIAFRNPYMREYRNLPELTKKALRGGMFHTGDMGKILPDGNLVVLGRKVECAYTEEGVIVPILIEVEMKKLYPGHWFHVAVYNTNAGNRICVFHRPDFKHTIDDVRSRLSGRVPEYTVPTELIEIETVPRLFSGKLNYAKLAEMVIV